MTTPLRALLAQVPTLNDPTEPFVFEAIGNTITGRWDIVHARFLDMSGGGTLDKDYVIVVDFDEKKGTYDFTESKHESESNLDVKGGTISFGGEKKVFSGKMTGTSKSFTFGGVNQTDAGISPVLSYEFETKRIKEPLFTFIEANGWERKKGFLGGLFSR